MTSQPPWPPYSQPPPPPPPPAPANHRKRNFILGGLGILLVIGAIGSIFEDEEPAPASAATPAVTTPAAAEPLADVPAQTTPATTSAAPTLKLPSMVGKGLQVAQDDAQAAGFALLTSHDALGRGRTQILDRDWQVCFQTPKAGRHGEDTMVDFGVVKLEEKCPSKDGGVGDVQTAGVKMPNLVGKSAAVAEEALGSNASITYIDGRGEDRTVLVPSNWKVCKQSPKGGQKFDGVPVKLTVVKFGESCRS